jgi:hypothetical protein
MKILPLIEPNREVKFLTPAQIQKFIREVTAGMRIIKQSVAELIFRVMLEP